MYNYYVPCIYRCSDCNTRDCILCYLRTRSRKGKPQLTQNLDLCIHMEGKDKVVYMGNLMHFNPLQNSQLMSCYTNSVNFLYACFFNFQFEPNENETVVIRMLMEVEEEMLDLPSQDFIIRDKGALIFCHSELE